MDVTEYKDKDDPYVPISFARNYSDEPVEVCDWWIHFVEAKNFLIYGDFRIDVLGKPALTGPNGFGKTIILKMIHAIIDIVSGMKPTVFYQVIRNTMDNGGTLFSRLFDSFSVTLVGGKTYTLVVVEYSIGLYNLLIDGVFYMEIKDTDSDVLEPLFDTNSVWIPAGRIGAPATFILQMIDRVEGNIDYQFLDKWYNFLMLGKEMNDENLVHRYADIPYECITSLKKARAVCDNIMRWMESNHLSHGEIELLIILLALKSGANLVIVDDIEVGLHVSVQLEITRLITEFYAKGVQVLYSTNSPSTFDNIFGNTNDLYATFFPTEKE